MNPHAVALGSLGGQARYARTTLLQRQTWARMGGLARAEQYSKAQLSRWAKLGGRPRKAAKRGAR